MRHPGVSKPGTQIWAEVLGGSFLLALVTVTLSSCIRDKVDPGSSSQASDRTKAAQQQPPDPETLFRARLCVLERPVPSLREVARCPSLGIITTPLNITPRRFISGFEGVTDETEWFMLDFAERFTVERGGRYELSLTTDDHALLWIDGRLVLENPPPRDRDPNRPPTVEQATVELAPGQHRFRLLYLHGKARRLALELSIRSPGGEWRTFAHRL